MSMKRIGKSVITVGAIALILTMAFPSTGRAQQYTRHCSDLIGAQNDALDKSQWERLIAVNRQYLSDCRAEFTADTEAHALWMIGTGMVALRQYEDAVPVLRRCIAVKPDYAICVTGLGVSFEALGRLQEAADSFSRAIAIGGYDNLNAASVEAAKRYLAAVEARLRDAEKAAPKPTPAVQSVSFGTGFFVTDKGYILTNKHVIIGCSSITTKDQHELKVIASEDEPDLALLKGEIEPPSVVTLRDGPALRVGETVVTFGYPLPDLLSSSGNITTGIVSALTGIGDSTTFIQISSPVQPGNSGGALLDSSGNVIGVVVGKLNAVAVAVSTGDIPQNVNFAVNLSAVKAFLAGSQIFYRKQSSTTESKVADIAAAAKLFSLQIRCER